MANGVPARTLVQRQYRAHEHEARDDQATSTVMSAKGTWKGKVPDQPKGPPVQRETQAGIDPTVKAGIGFTNGVGHK